MNFCMKYKCYSNTDFSEGTDISKTDASKECDICHHWYFLNKNVEYEPYLCNDYHDLMERAINLNNVAIVFVKGNDYRIHFWYLSKNDATNAMKNANLNEKGGSL